jgi:hypothetical protein
MWLRRKLYLRGGYCKVDLMVEVNELSDKFKEDG